MIFSRKPLSTQDLDQELKLWLRSHFSLPLFDWTPDHRGLWREFDQKRLLLGFCTEGEHLHFRLGLQFLFLPGSFWQPTSKGALEHQQIYFEFLEPLQKPTRKELQKYLKALALEPLKEFDELLQSPGKLLQQMQSPRVFPRFKFHPGGALGSFNHALYQVPLYQSLGNTSAIPRLFENLIAKTDLEPFLRERIQLLLQEISSHV